MEKFSPLKGVLGKTSVQSEPVATNGSMLSKESEAISDSNMQDFQSLNEKVFGKLQVLLCDYVKQYP